MKKVSIAILFSAFFLTASVPAGAILLKGDICSLDTEGVLIRGRTYVPLLDVCRTQGIGLEWDSVAKRFVLEKNGDKAVLLLGSDRIYYGGKIKKFRGKARLYKSKVIVPISLARKTFRKVFQASVPAYTGTVVSPVCPPAITKKTAPIEGKTRRIERIEKHLIRKVVIDPGHGGKDPGAVSRYGFHEKTVVLDTAKRLKRELESMGIEAVLTRSDDRFLTLERRSRIANEQGADLFISVHANASRSRWTDGFEVYYFGDARDDNARTLEMKENSVLQYEERSYYVGSNDVKAIVAGLGLDENRQESSELAKYIRSAAGKLRGIKDRRVRTARFYVIKNTSMPCVLVELAYLSNKREAKLLKASGFRQEMARAIADGVMRFKHKYEETNGFSN